MLPPISRFQMEWSIGENGQIEVLVPRGKGARSSALDAEARVHAKYVHR